MDYYFAVEKYDDHDYWVAIIVPSLFWKSQHCHYDGEFRPKMEAKLRANGFYRWMEGVYESMEDPDIMKERLEALGYIEKPEILYVKF